MDKNSHYHTEPLAYGIPGATRATGLGRSLLYEEMRAGRLKSFLLGRRRLIDADDLKAWLRAYRDGGAA
jgi:excisionase family DNA binding protein